MNPGAVTTRLFSLGTLLYEIATGDRPFKGDTKLSVLSSIVRDEPTSITELNVKLPRHLGRIVKKSLEKDPTRRYQTVLDVRNDLDELKGEIDSGELLVAGAFSADPAELVLSPAVTRAYYTEESLEAHIWMVEIQENGRSDSR